MAMELCIVQRRNAATRNESNLEMCVQNHFWHFGQIKDRYVAILSLSVYSYLRDVGGRGGWCTALMLLPTAGNTSLFLLSQKQRREEPSGGFPNHLVKTYLDK